MDKHVLILTTTHDFLRKFELENVKILQRMGCTVHYAANMKEPQYLSDERFLQELGVRTHHIDIARSPFQWRENRRAFLQIRELLREFDIRMIHCHTPVGGVLGRLAGHFFRDWRVFVIYTAHGFHFYKGAPLQNHLLYYRVEKWLAHYTDVLITINEEDYRSALRFHLRRGGRVYKIPGAGLNLQKFRPQEEALRAVFRRKLWIGADEFFLVSVGELNENKNHEVVLEALELLRAEGKLANIRYGICGDGFLRETLARKIAEKKLQDVVVLYGYCRNIPEILGCADASVFPSKREGLGMAGLESLAMGVPVIAADNRGTREYMEHGRNGFVRAYDDVRGLADCITALRQMDVRRRQRMAQSCVNTVKPFEKRYTSAVMTRIYESAEDVYERVAESQYCDGSVQSV